MRRPWRTIPLVLVLVTLGLVRPTRADLPGTNVAIWDIHTGGIWRKEVRARELARWYRHYEWTTIQRLWLKRRAEGVWINGQSVDFFTCRSHCILQNPNGPGVWRIWRQFRRVDVRRFRVHYRITWAGWLNPVLANAFPNPDDPNPNNGRFSLAMDHMETVLPMEPQDPNPFTPVNEAVMIMTEDGASHFLGEPGFEMMPDTERNPNGFQLASTAQSEELLPPPSERMMDPPWDPMPGMVEIAPGVLVEWLVDENGNVQVDRDGLPGPDPILGPTVLGNQKHQGLIAPATGMDGNMLAMDQGNTPLQLYCWCLDEFGNVMGAMPGQTIVGPPVDLDGNGAPDNAIGAPIPMDPTVRDENDNLDPTAQPVDMVIEEEDEPTPQELDDLNLRLINAGFQPIFPPFKLCIKRIITRRMWGIDRRVVMDTWFHHWYWRVQHHIALTSGLHRIWITRAGLSQFLSDHHHYVVGQPPIWYSLNITQVRFFRICYRIYCPRPNDVRVKIDELWAVVPVNPENPASDLMLLTTESNENRLLPPGVLAGVQPDPFPTDVRVETLDPIRDGLDAGGGGTGAFDGDLSPLNAPPHMANIAVVANRDLQNELNNNQLQLYCWVLDFQGMPKAEVIQVPKPGGSLDPQSAAGALILTMPPTPAIPSFTDPMGNFMPDPTMLGLEMASGAVGDVGNVPPRLDLGQSYPNPFESTATLKFEIPAAAGPGNRVPVRLVVFDPQGREVVRLIDGEMDPGRYVTALDASQMTGHGAGVYFFKLTIPGWEKTSKFTFMK